ncbi:DUF3592 domain-containing protein [Saccharicrinis aurantiacus]|uniref:DUF3592 domain-containing protein n=1 Tax=Saccharicrinis aurantiacus TaxID=1849719 RepID=UPI00248FD7CD|nr:DUF3592 domain-containing protein [Saccharicrinis aurantiacus]
MLDEIKYWDWKSIGIGILTILVFSLGLYFLSGNASNEYRQFKEKKYEDSVSGEVVKVKNVEHLNQSRHTGNNISTIAYKVTYRYSVNMEVYEKVMTLNSGLKKNQLFISRIKAGQKRVIVKFDLGNPQNSIIQID